MFTSTSSAAFCRQMMSASMTEVIYGTTWQSSFDSPSLDALLQSLCKSQTLMYSHCEASQQAWICHQLTVTLSPAGAHNLYDSDIATVASGAHVNARRDHGNSYTPICHVQCATATIPASDGYVACCDQRALLPTKCCNSGRNEGTAALALQPSRQMPPSSSAA
eukprot:TRINITY_DN23277_c0_g1_i1.p1 TRINITY_DN23277_c0_g1~~TRINITY_DN23277_c0_g1_i1.p1  ORF type:complete len:164 (+),score=8.68 TRINITY_DN23277_c0_g1_i1:285-776(+)